MPFRNYDASASATVPAVRAAGVVFVAVAVLLIAGFWLVPVEFTVLGTSVSCGTPIANTHLGVSIRHVRRLVFERRIPYVKWGHLLRFDIDDVNYWVARSTVEAINDTALSFRQ